MIVFYCDQTSHTLSAPLFLCFALALSPRVHWFLSLPFFRSRLPPRLLPPQMSFGQLVIGPPGAGKTSYVCAMHSFLTSPSNPAPRIVCTVNLDPANYTLPYPVSIDIKELIDMEEVMETFQLGPNGGQTQTNDEGNAARTKRGD